MTNKKAVGIFLEEGCQTQVVTRVTFNFEDLLVKLPATGIMDLFLEQKMQEYLCNMVSSGEFQMDLDLIPGDSDLDPEIEKNMDVPDNNPHLSHGQGLYIEYRDPESDGTLSRTKNNKGRFDSTIFCRNVTCKTMHLNTILIAKNAIIIVNRTAS